MLFSSTALLLEVWTLTWVATLDQEVLAIGLGPISFGFQDTRWFWSNWVIPTNPWESMSKPTAAILGCNMIIWPWTYLEPGL